MYALKARCTVVASHSPITFPSFHPLYSGPVHIGVIYVVGLSMIAWCVSRLENASWEWLLVIPVFICVAFSVILPLMTVVNYSVQDIIGPTQHVFVGTEWFRNIMTDPDLREALGRQVIFSACVLLFEIPLGVGLALSMPASGWGPRAGGCAASTRRCRDCSAAKGCSRTMPSPR